MIANGENSQLTRMLFTSSLLFIIRVISGATFNQSDASFSIIAKLSNVQFDYTVSQQLQICAQIIGRTNHTQQLQHRYHIEQVQSHTG